MQNTQLSAVCPDGMLQWQITLSQQRQDTISLPSIAVDAADTAFVGSTDGIVRAISTQGRVLWTLPAGGPGTTAPACSLGVGGKLVIVGTDGLLREYS